MLQRERRQESWSAAGDVKWLGASKVTPCVEALLDCALDAVLGDVGDLVDCFPFPLGERQQVVHVGDGVVALEVLACLPARCDRLEEDRGGGPKVGGKAKSSPGVSTLAARRCWMMAPLRSPICCGGNSARM